MGLSRPRGGPRARPGTAPAAHRRAHLPGPVPALRQGAARAPNARCAGPVPGSGTGPGAPATRDSGPPASPAGTRRGARACERDRSRRRAAECIARGLCAKCGKEPPVPDRTLCRRCTGKRCAAERARYAKAKAAGRLYGGRDPKERRRNARGTTRRRYDARRAAGLCTRCGLRPPVEGGTACEPCRDARRAGERARWAARRAAGLCGTCGGDHVRRRLALRALRRAPGGSAVEERHQPQALRQGGGRAGSAPTAASRPRARPGVRRARTRSHVRSAGYRGLPPFPPSYRVIETGDGARTTGRSRAGPRWRPAWRSRGSPPR